MVFDKTGTLTYGKMKISEALFFGVDEMELIQFACGLEKASSHPISGAFADYEEKNNIIPYPVYNFKLIEGAGICGEFNEKTLYLVKGDYLSILNIDNTVSETEKEFSEKGYSIVYAVTDGKIAAIFGISENSKPKALNVLCLQATTKMPPK